MVAKKVRKSKQADKGYRDALIEHLQYEKDFLMKAIHARDLLNNINLELEEKRRGNVYRLGVATGASLVVIAYLVVCYFK